MQTRKMVSLSSKIVVRATTLICALGDGIGARARGGEDAFLNRAKESHSRLQNLGREVEGTRLLLL